MKNILNKIDYINPTDKKTQEKLKDFSVDKLYEYSKKTNNFKKPYFILDKQDKNKIRINMNSNVNNNINISNENIFRSNINNDMTNNVIKENPKLILKDKYNEKIIEQ